MIIRQKHTRWKLCRSRSSPAAGEVGTCGSLAASASGRVQYGAGDRSQRSAGTCGCPRLHLRRGRTPRRGYMDHLVARRMDLVCGAGDVSG
jgi:hypothetical protein